MASMPDGHCQYIFISFSLQSLIDALVGNLTNDTLVPTCLATLRANTLSCFDGTVDINIENICRLIFFSVNVPNKLKKLLTAIMLKPLARAPAN